MEEIKSNINISSNMYIRKEKNGVPVYLDEDYAFVAQVSGRTALVVTKEKCSALNNAKLSMEQELELKAGAFCGSSGNLLKEQTHGPVLVNGERKWVCRCENENCSQYQECMNAPYAKKITRTNSMSVVEFEVDQTYTALTYKSLNLDFSIEDTELKLFSPIEEENQEVTEELEVLKDDELPLSQNTLSHDTYEVIAQPNLIIESPIDQCILVNAGPGTGKTYSALARICYIAQNKLLDDLSGIMVLCYTKSAESVINQRITEGVLQGQLPPEVQDICVCTFDSLATQYLVEVGANFEGLDYNQRIEAFNLQLKKEMFETFSYVIIDEIQDLVNQRAEMTLNILNCLSCGYLLFGDKCQAIYDYDTHRKGRSTMNSVDFYNQLESILPDGSKKYEFYINRRQDSSLEPFSTAMRTNLLTGNVQQSNEAVKAQMDTLEPLLEVDDLHKKISSILKNASYAHETIAILCRSNGDAQILSQLLNRKEIQHTLTSQPTDRPNYTRWIADILWDHCEDYIQKEEFIQRFYARAKGNDDMAEQFFSQLRNVSLGDNNQSPLTGIEKKILFEKLFTNSAPEYPLLLPEKCRVTVSTIHRAKGQEFDHVFFQYSPLKINAETTEEARIAYVAVTRPKKKLTLLTKNKRYKFAFTQKRRVFSYCRKQNKKICTCISFGGEDIKGSSFVDGDFVQVIKRQAYIAKKVAIHDTVELHLEDGQYQVMHIQPETGKLVALGYLSQTAQEEIKYCVGIRADSQVPQRIHQLYVTNIVTYYQKRIENSTPELFRKSKVWLGIEIGGFAKVVNQHGE